MSARTRDTGVSRGALEDRRFRRAQVRPGRKRGRGRVVPWRLVLQVTVALLALAALGAGMKGILTSAAFNVQTIVVHGAHRLSVGEVLALLDGLKGQSLFAVSLPAWRDRVLGSPWVAEAHLRRVLPATIEVSIVERTPMATARIGHQLFLVDQRGAVVDEYGPQYADVDLPIIDGLSTGIDDKAKGEEATLARRRAGLAARVLASLSPHRELLQRVSQIDVHDPHDAVVMLKNDGTRLHIGDASFADRLQSYLELAPALQARVQAIDDIDLRFEPRIFVRPAAAPAIRPGPESTP